VFKCFLARYYLMATEFKKLLESGKIDAHLLTPCSVNCLKDVSIHLKDGINAREYANSLIEEGTIHSEEDIYIIEKSVINTVVYTGFLQFLTQRDEIEKIESFRDLSHLQM